MASSTLGRWPLLGGARFARAAILRPGVGGEAQAALAIGDYLFGLDDQPAPTELAANRQPDADGGFRWTLAWRTDVHVARNGLEQRIATLTNPRQRFEGSFLLDDADTRTVRQLLSAGPSGTYDLPLAHEAVAAIVAPSGGTLYISSAASALADWIAPGRRVYVRGPGGDAYTVTITGSSGGTINVSASPPTDGWFPANQTIIYPCETVRFENGQPIARYPVTASRWSFSARANARAQPGGGAPTAVTHDGMRVLDRRPFQEKTTGETFDGGVEFVDNGAMMSSSTAWSRTKHRRQGVWRVDSPSDRQWWKAFLTERRGRWKPFLFPTWRPDLALHEQPSAGSAYVRVTTNYVDDWYASLAHRRFQVEYADRSVTYHTLHSYTVGASYTELTFYETLANPLPTGGVTRVSFLETARLDADEVAIEYGSGWKGRIELPSVVVQEQPTRTAAWPDTAAKLRSAFGYGTWVSAWLCDEQLGDLSDSIGGVTLAASSTPTYRNAGLLADDYAVGFDSASDAFSAADASTFQITTAGQIAVFLSWRPAAPADGYLFVKISGSTYYAVYLDSSGFVNAAAFDGSTFAAATIAVNHIDGNYHDILFTLNRDDEQRIAVASDLGVATAVNIAAVGSLSNAGQWQFGGGNPNRGRCAFAAVATGGVLGLKNNAATAIANLRRYTGRS